MVRQNARKTSNAIKAGNSSESEEELKTPSSTLATAEAIEQVESLQLFVSSFYEVSSDHVVYLKGVNSSFGGQVPKAA